MVHGAGGNTAGGNTVGGKRLRRVGEERCRPRQQSSPYKTGSEIAVGRWGPHILAGLRIALSFKDETGRQSPLNRREWQPPARVLLRDRQPYAPSRVGPFFLIADGWRLSRMDIGSRHAARLARPASPRGAIDARLARRGPALGSTAALGQGCRLCLRHMHMVQESLRLDDDGITRCGMVQV